MRQPNQRHGIGYDQEDQPASRRAFHPRTNEDRAGHPRRTLNRDRPRSVGHMPKAHVFATHRTKISVSYSGVTALGDLRMGTFAFIHIAERINKYIGAKFGKSGQHHRRDND